MVETQNELQTAEAETQNKSIENRGLTVDEFIVVDELPLEEEDKIIITTLLGEYKKMEADLNKALECWREEFDKRKAAEQELNSLGQGTSFLDVEKLRKDITCKKREIYNTLETIRGKKDSLETERGIDNSKLQEKRDELRTIKKQCEDQLKEYKKIQLDALKQKRHKMTIDEDLRKEANMNKTDWKEEVKARTKTIEDIIPKKVEELRLEQEKNIGRFEQEIADLQAEIDQKYGACEEKIRELQRKVERLKIELGDLEMSRDNRITFALMNLMNNSEELEVRELKEGITAK